MFRILRPRCKAFLAQQRFHVKAHSQYHFIGFNTFELQRRFKKSIPGTTGMKARAKKAIEAKIKKAENNPKKGQVTFSGLKFHK